MKQIMNTVRPDKRFIHNVAERRQQLFKTFNAIDGVGPAHTVNSHNYLVAKNKEKAKKANFDKVLTWGFIIVSLLTALVAACI